MIQHVYSRHFQFIVVPSHTPSNRNTRESLMISWHPVHRRQSPLFRASESGGIATRCSDALKTSSIGFSCDFCDLEREQQQESHHKAEKTHGLGQGEAQDGIREQLLFERGVPGVAND